MPVLLDTDHLSVFVSFHEQVLGCHSYLAQAKSAADIVRGYQMLDRVLSAFTAALVLPFDNAAAAAVAGLTRQRVRIATMDLRIAAIANDPRLNLADTKFPRFHQGARIGHSGLDGLTICDLEEPSETMLLISAHPDH